MYSIKTTVEISAAHFLELGYESKCQNLHGHNWIIDVYCRSEILDDAGMVVDFTSVKNVVKKELDHKNLNEVLHVNPTAENIAEYVFVRLNLGLANKGEKARCYRVDVRETSGNVASFEL